MPQVTLTIGNKTYRMACAEGEEPRIQALASHFSARVDELGGRFPRMPSDHLFLMAALIVTDELFEAREELQGTLKQIARLGGALKTAEAGKAANSGEMARIVKDASARLDTLGDPKRPEAGRDVPVAEKAEPAEPPASPDAEDLPAPESVKSGKLAKNAG